MTSDEMPECPLCMVELFYDDLNFYPCSCGYQICRFCWSKILNEENGLCPACRRAYDSEAPASFTPLSEEQFQKLKREKRQKERKNKTIENRKHLADIRVVQKNLAFVIGLPQRFAEQADILKSNEYFGKYGKVFKVVVNRNATQPGSQNQSTVGAYVTFVKGDDTIQAILDLNKLQMEGRTLKASLGTTKYCSQFLKGASCTKGECMYLHELGEEAASFTKEEMQQNKHTEYERKLIEDYIEQNSLATDSRLSSSSPSTTSQSTTSTQSTSHQNQNQSRPQHTSECRDHSSSSSNSNTPPSSRRQTKSESHTQRHAQHQNRNQPNHRPPVISGNTASSSGDTSAAASQRTPRKNSQNYKSQSHNHISHTRSAQGQKHQKQRPQQLQPQTHIQQTNLSSSSNQQQSLSQSTENLKPPRIPSSTLPVSNEAPSCTSAGDSSSIDSGPHESQTSNPYSISAGLSLPSNLLGFDRQNSQNDDQQTFSNVTSSCDSSNIPQSSASASTETSSTVQSSSSLLQPSIQMRQQTQVMNGLSGSAVGMPPPYQLPSMCSYSTLQLMLDYQRQQLQQQQQQETSHQYHQLINSFDSQCNPTTSFPSEQTNQSEASMDVSSDRRFRMHSTQSSKWPVPDPMHDVNPSSSLLMDAAFSAHDDAANLDFDPVKESQQALAALLEHERNNSILSNVGSGSYLSNNNSHNQGLTPPPGFEMLPHFQAPSRPVMRPPNLNLCHPGMMGYNYYSSGVPPGSHEMSLANDNCINRSDKGSSMNLSGTPANEHPPHLSANSADVSSSMAAPNSPGLSFSVKALQDTLRCVLPEETNITFDPSLMREMQYPINIHATQNTGIASQLPTDAISSSNNPPGLGQSIDALSNTSAKDSRQHEYYSLWPTTSRKGGTDDGNLCMRNDAVWSSPMTPPGFGSSVLSFLGGLGSSSVHRVGVEGQRSAISVDNQSSVTATGDQQQAINKL